MSRYAKAIAATLTVVGTWGGTAAADNGINAVEWFGLIGALAAVVAVWAVPNEEPADG